MNDRPARASLDGDSIFAHCDMTATRLMFEARELAPKLELLTAIRDYELRPAANLREAARRLDEAAQFLRECADKAPKPIKETV
jgi:hypothetical protein